MEGEHRRQLAALDRDGPVSDAALGGHFAEKIKAVTVRTTEIQKRYAEIETTPRAAPAGQG